MEYTKTPVSMSISVSLPEEIYDWIREYAQEVDVPMSAAIRSIIVAYRAEVENGRD